MERAWSPAAPREYRERVSPREMDRRIKALVERERARTGSRYSEVTVRRIGADDVS